MSADDAASLAPWVRTMPLDAQILVTGATLVLADVKLRANGELPAPIDEVAMREETDPRRAAALARELADAYQSHQTDSEDMARVVGLATAVADKIDEHFPA